MQQLVLDIGMAPEASFSRFLPGSNAGAIAALQEGMQHLTQASASASAIIPVYLWGETGTGKSHLLQAISLHLRDQGLSCGWLSASQRSALSHVRGEFQTDWQAILLDDVHQYSPSEQQQAFNWFINASFPADGKPRWVVATGNAPAVDLALRDDLRSRLGSGLTFELHALDDAQRKQVIQQQALERGLHLSDEVAQYLLLRYARDLSSLSELLARLDLHALRTQRAVTVPLLKDVLHQMGEAKSQITPPTT